MHPCRAAILVLIGGLSVSAAGAMGSAEVLRYPVSESADGSRMLLPRGGTGTKSLTLPTDARDGYRFSWQESFYELVTYSSGPYAVLSLDTHLKGRSLGHTLFLKGRSNPSEPMPEWVSDDRYLLTGLPQYSGSLALRYSKASMAPTSKLSADQILKDTILPFMLSGLPSPSDADKAAATAMAADLAFALAPVSTLASYWMEFLRRDPHAAPNETDFVSTRKVYGLVLVPEEEYAREIRDIRAKMESGGTPAYRSPNAALLLSALASALPAEPEKLLAGQASSKAAAKIAPAAAESLDLLRNIPEARARRPDAVAVLVGNRSYAATGIPSADSAGKDADLIRAYLVNALGFSEENILYLQDATLADFNKTFGTAFLPEGQLFRRVKPGAGEVFIYYSGRGAPSPDGASAYLLPVDCDPAFVQLSGYSLETLLGNLAKLPFKSLTIVLETSFSGVSLGAIAGALPREKTAFFLSASAGQTSFLYSDTGRSLFTYCLAKGIQDLAAARPASISSGDLSAYVRVRVEALAKGLFGREQTPVFFGDPDLVLVEPRYGP